MNDKQLSLKDVAMALGVKPYRITYAMTTGLVPEPRTRFGNRRVFDVSDLDRLADYFGIALIGWQPETSSVDCGKAIVLADAMAPSEPSPAD